MKLHIEPRKVKTWEEFCRENPRSSIALDGYVRGEPRFDSNGPYTNFNHHEQVDRLATRSTCEQVYVAIKQGLLDSYRTKGKVCGNIYINDPDQDTCTAIWLLQNHERIEGPKSEPLVNRLVYIEDLMDVTAGAYPFNPASETMRKISWVFEPYTNVRMSGKLFKMDEHEMRNVVEAVSERISKHTLGDASELEPDTRYLRLGGNANYAIIKEIGAQARSQLFHDGVKAFISVRENENNTYTYSLGKMSPFINFPIEELYDILNSAEGISKDDNDRWGGGNTIGGSPRKRGSKLTPAQLEAIINDYLETRNHLMIK